MHEEIKNLIQRTVNLLEKSSIWDDRASVEAQALGLEGEAYRMKYLSRRAHELVQKYQLCAENLFSDLQTTTKIFPEPGQVEQLAIMSREAYMTAILQKLWVVYFDLHKLMNEFTGLLYHPLGQHLGCYLEELLCILGELHLAEREYNWANWEYHHISRYQVSLLQNNVYDKYKRK